MFFFTPVIGVFVYHECTMRQHAEMGDVLTGKLKKITILRFRFSSRLPIYLYLKNKLISFFLYMCINILIK
jgi:hypothetical protein